MLLFTQQGGSNEIMKDPVFFGGLLVQASLIQCISPAFIVIILFFLLNIFLVSAPLLLKWEKMTGVPFSGRLDELHISRVCALYSYMKPTAVSSKNGSLHIYTLKTVTCCMPSVSLSRSLCLPPALSLSLSPPCSLSLSPPCSLSLSGVCWLVAAVSQYLSRLA